MDSVVEDEFCTMLLEKFELSTRSLMLPEHEKITAPDEFYEYDMAGVEVPGCSLFCEQTGWFPRVSMLQPPENIAEFAQPTQRNALFWTFCVSQGEPCTLMIDSGSTNNLVSTDAVERLGFKRLKHPTPYKLSWLEEGHQFPVKEQCDVEFSINEYKDKIMCDIVPKMDACDILLGRPWQYDRDIIHFGKANHYQVCKDDKKHTLVPITNKEETVAQPPAEAAAVEENAEDSSDKEEATAAIETAAEESLVNDETPAEIPEEKAATVEESALKPAEAAPAEEKAEVEGKAEE